MKLKHILTNRIFKVLTATKKAMMLTDGNIYLTLPNEIIAINWEKIENDQG